MPAAYAKNGQTRTIPMNSRTREVLARRKEQSRSAFVFSKPNGQPYKSMDKHLAKVVQQAGLSGSGISLHFLRHTFASRLVMSGADLRTIQECGGWADLSLVQRYSHLSASHKTTAVQRIAGEFHNAIHNSPVPDEVVHIAKRLVSM